ncbi:uncharacterized protein LOC126591271 isoform X2 [Malus sylvestris]|nr:uncharacterized protein LOC126591271 isoform X2 [Malus sylvestris]
MLMLLSLISVRRSESGAVTCLLFLSMCLYNYTSTVQCKATIGSNAASPLPIPPLIVPRSFSIPSSSQRAMALHVARHLESPQVPGKAEEVASPPLTPISLSNLKPVSNVSEVASQSSPIRADELVFVGSQSSPILGSS